MKQGVIDMVESPGPAPREYSFRGNQAAEALFGQRTAETDLAFVLPHLKPGMNVVDCGCGTGTITIGLAARVAPGEVVGFDFSESAISAARGFAEAAGQKNVRFEVANVYEPDLPEGTFDVAVFSGVLAHLDDPARALAVANRLLKPGGLVAACEPQKEGDWFAGPYAHHMKRMSSLAPKHWGSGDPHLGLRLSELMSEAGFTRIEAQPGYSPALSSPRRMIQFVERQAEQEQAVERLVQIGFTTREELPRILEEVRLWAASEGSVAAYAECRAIGWKPAP